VDRFCRPTVAATIIPAKIPIIFASFVFILIEHWHHSKGAPRPGVSVRERNGLGALNRDLSNDLGLAAPKTALLRWVVTPNRRVGGDSES
jgi:hypothetical protein